MLQTCVLKPLNWYSDLTGCRLPGAIQSILKSWLHWASFGFLFWIQSFQNTVWNRKTCRNVMTLQIGLWPVHLVCRSDTVRDPVFTRDHTVCSDVWSDSPGTDIHDSGVWSWMQGRCVLSCDPDHSSRTVWHVLWWVADRIVFQDVWFFWDLCLSDDCASEVTHIGTFVFMPVPHSPLIFFCHCKDSD